MSVRPSVCLSVSVSHAGILSIRLNIELFFTVLLTISDPRGGVLTQTYPRQQRRGLFGHQQPHIQIQIHSTWDIKLFLTPRKVRLQLLVVTPLLWTVHSASQLGYGYLSNKPTTLSLEHPASVCKITLSLRSIFNQKRILR